MPKTHRATALKRSQRGDYVRHLGRDRAGKQPKFRLGFDKAEAEKRFQAILVLWDYCPQCLTDDREIRRYWDGKSLEAARAVARGEMACVGKGDYEESTSYFRRVNEMNARSPIEFKPDNQFVYDFASREIRQQIDDCQEMLSKATGQSLHQALKEYSKYLGHEYVDGHGHLTDNGKTKQDQIKTITSYLPDWDLAKLDYQGCDEVFGIFRRRPISKRYQRPMSRKSCSNYLGELNRFFAWLHTSKEFLWKRPEDFNSIKRNPRDLDEDAEHESKDVPTWKVDELRTIFEYATPIERIFLLLGLNCAYGADQAGTLRNEHVRLPTATRRRAVIRRIRRKKKTLSIHLLWHVTEQGLKWAMERRASNTESHYLLVTKSGIPYWRKTKSGNRSQLIPNLWRRLISRIQKDREGFPFLPFNSLRDTSSNFVRQISGSGEIASLHVAHKHQTSDKDLNRYANPLRRLHFKTLKRLELKLAQVLNAVADPFPAEQPAAQKMGGPNLTPGQIRRIRQLKNEGYKRTKIAEIVAVSPSAVHRYLRKPK